MKKFLLLSILVSFIFTLYGCNTDTENEIITTGNSSTNTTTNEVVINCEEESIFEDCKYDDIEGASIVDRGMPEYSMYNAVIYEVNIRNYTPEGTFEAFEEHLPRLKQLGVDILWLMPIHPISLKNRNGSLGSWYAVADFYDVNPEYGTLEDFESLIGKAHEMGFKVILDLVANHTGWDNAWITEHKDWYTQDSSGNVIIPPGTNWADVADLNYNNSKLKEEMIEVMKYWVRDYDVDGYRADYAGGVPQSFWEEATSELEKIKPVFMLAEDDTKIEFLDNAFHSNYSFEMMYLLNELAKGNGTPVRLKFLLSQNKTKYPELTFPMYYTTNHDINAWEGSIPTLLGGAANAMNTFVFTIPGMPLIYSGQEINLNRSLRFFDKDLITWGNWELNKTHDFYEQLVMLKKTNPALWHDDLSNLVFLNNNNGKVLSYIREKDDNQVIVVLNMSSSNQKVKVQINEAAGVYKDYFNDDIVRLHDSEVFNLAPWGYKVFIK